MSYPYPARSRCRDCHPPRHAGITAQQLWSGGPSWKGSKESLSQRHQPQGWRVVMYRSDSPGPRAVGPGPRPQGHHGNGSEALAHLQPQGARPQDGYPAPPRPTARQSAPCSSVGSIILQISRHQVHLRLGQAPQTDYVAAAASRLRRTRPAEQPPQPHRPGQCAGLLAPPPRRVLKTATSPQRNCPLLAAEHAHPLHSFNSSWQPSSGLPAGCHHVTAITQAPTPAAPQNPVVAEVPQLPGPLPLNPKHLLQQTAPARASFEPAAPEARQEGREPRGDSARVPLYSPQASEFFMEQHVENVLKNHQQRIRRRKQLESEMQRCSFSSFSQACVTTADVRGTTSDRTHGTSSQDWEDPAKPATCSRPLKPSCSAPKARQHHPALAHSLVCKRPTTKKNTTTSPPRFFVRIGPSLQSALPHPGPGPLERRGLDLIVSCAAPRGPSGQELRR
ncbi:unnamed protein product [Arctogadus glacialis]